MQYITICIVWLFIGYLFWRAVQHGSYKTWYIDYKEDYSTSSAAYGWRRALPIICLAGPINLLVMFFSDILHSMAFKYGIVLRFKIPQGTPKCRY